MIPPTTMTNPSPWCLSNHLLSFLPTPPPTTMTNPSPSSTRGVFQCNGKVSPPKINHYLHVATVPDLKTTCVYLRLGFSPFTGDLFSPLLSSRRVKFRGSIFSANSLTSHRSVAVSPSSISAPISQPLKPPWFCFCLTISVPNLAFLAFLCFCRVLSLCLIWVLHSMCLTKVFTRTQFGRAFYCVYFGTSQ